MFRSAGLQVAASISPRRTTSCSGVEAFYVDLGDTSLKLVGPLFPGGGISANFDNNYVIARGRVGFKF